MNTPWIKDVRRVALFVFVVSLIDWLLVCWRFASLGNGFWIWNTQIIAVQLLSLIFCGFFFALYGNKEQTGLPNWLRNLSLGAAILDGAVAALGFPRWILSFAPFLSKIQSSPTTGESSPILGLIKDPMFPLVLSNLLSEVSLISVVLLLIALFEQTTKGADYEFKASRLLSATTYLALIGLAIVSTGNVFRLASVSSNKDIWIRLVIREACLWTVPFVIWRGWLARGKSDEAVRVSDTAS